jgi:hypothetical protein
MKKLGIVAVLLAAGVFAASGLFAQGLVFDGYVNSGLGVVVSTEENAPDPFIAAVGNDSWNNAWTVRMNAKYTNEAGNVGAQVQFAAQSGWNFFAVPFAYGWFSAFDNILTVKGGIVNDGTWSTGGAHLVGDQGAGLGTLVRITPISGLDIGVGAYVTNTLLGFQDNAVFDGNFGLSYGSSRYFARELDQAKYTFNLGYTLPDVVKFVGSFRTKSETDVSGGAPYVTSRTIMAVSVLAVPKLKAIVELELDNLQDFEAMKVGDETAWEGKFVDDPIASSGKINIGETFQYDALLDGKLLVGLWAVEFLSQAEDTDFAFYVNPWVSYAIGSIVPRLDLTYGASMQAGFNNGGLTWRRGNFSPKYIDDFSFIAIRPSVKFNIDANTFVEIGDFINIENAPKGTWVHAPDDDSRISNAFYVDFKWSF